MGSLETAHDELMDAISKLESLTDFSELSEMEKIEAGKILDLCDRYREVYNLLEETEPDGFEGEI